MLSRSLHSLLSLPDTGGWMERTSQVERSEGWQNDCWFDFSKERLGRFSFCTWNKRRRKCSSYNCPRYCLLCGSSSSINCVAATRTKTHPPATKFMMVSRSLWDIIFSRSWELFTGWLLETYSLNALKLTCNFFCCWPTTICSSPRRGKTPPPYRKNLMNAICTFLKMHSNSIPGDFSQKILQRKLCKLSYGFLKVFHDFIKCFVMILRFSTLFSPLCLFTIVFFIFTL